MSEYVASLDVESIGLYGDPTAWALVVGDSTGKIAFEYSAQLMDVHERANECQDFGHRSPGDRDWYKTYVGPATTDKAWNKVLANGCTAGCHHDSIGTVGGLLDMFANEWELLKKRMPGIVLLADCPFPVETNFLRRATRAGEVYPLLDVNTLVHVHGNPKFSRLESELPIHNPLADARQSYRIYVELLAKEAVK